MLSPETCVKHVSIRVDQDANERTALDEDGLKVSTIQSLRMASGTIVCRDVASGRKQRKGESLVTRLEF